MTGTEATIFRFFATLFYRKCVVLWIFGLAMGLFIALPCVSAQTAPPSPLEERLNLRIFLITMEPGDEPWERFGHDAILIQGSDSQTNEPGMSAAYNYGVFDFDAPNFLGNFILGKMSYWMDAFDGAQTLESYRQSNRTVWMDELNLSPSRKQALFNALERAREPANKFYRYDYFLNNCTTKVRDLLDEQTNGAIARQLKARPTAHTFRSRARIGLAENFWLYSGIELALGRNTDRPMTAWEDCFLPERLMANLREVAIDDGSGKRVPLIAKSTVLFQSTRLPLPDHPPMIWWVYLVIGVVVGLLMFWAAHRRAWKICLTMLISWFLFCSAAAGFLVLMWGFTDHTAAYYNENLFLFSPVSMLLLIGLIPKNRARWMAPLAWAAVGLVGVNLLVKLFPGRQWNWEWIALTLPIHLAVAIVAQRKWPLPAKLEKQVA